MTVPALFFVVPVTTPSVVEQVFEPSCGAPVVNLSNLPAPVAPQQVHPIVVVVVDAVVVVVVTVVVVVVVVLPGGGHVPPGPHASQQLDADPTHAELPLGGRHLPSRLILHFVSPSSLVRQQVTKPGRPQVDRSAHRSTTSSHASRSNPASTAASATSSTQLTYSS